MFIALIQAAQDSTTKAVISENSKTFSSIDPMGIGMTAIGMAVVFISLLLLYLLFLNISKVLAGKKGSTQKHENKPGTIKTAGMPGDVNAAIALALHLYTKQIHDNESMVLTMNKVGRTYSPWSSKIYGLRQLPR